MRRTRRCTAGTQSEAQDIEDVSGSSQSVAPAPAGRPTPHPIFWVIAAALVVIAVGVVFRPAGTFGPMAGGPAFAQSVSSGGSRGVFAFSGQLSKGTFGVYVVDVDAMTIWAYEYLPHKGCMRLAASRTWRYDRYLENYNICDLPPEAVERMIEDQRQYRLEASESQVP